MARSTDVIVADEARRAVSSDRVVRQVAMVSSPRAFARDQVSKSLPHEVWPQLRNRGLTLGGLTSAQHLRGLLLPWTPHGVVIAMGGSGSNHPLLTRCDQRHHVSRARARLTATGRNHERTPHRGSGWIPTLGPRTSPGDAYTIGRANQAWVHSRATLPGPRLDRPDVVCCAWAERRQSRGHWRDELEGSVARARPRAKGLFAWVVGLGIRGLGFEAWDRDRGRDPCPHLP